MEQRKKQQETYNVVFAYTSATGGYEGVITWTSFSSKEDFDKWYTEDIKKMQRIVEEGVTPKRAVELVRQTPATCRMAAAFQETINCSPPGEINEEILKHQMFNAKFAIIDSILHSKE